ncbi:MAG: pantoate--beta-alanine ligase [Desulfobacteraceae bacterium]|nr:pantoate--beta-alanine ligase [Desulfobacteraceae bacterium]
MEILKTKKHMQEWSVGKKKTSKTICFVPTMGYLHQGHISLLEKGKPLCDELVLSIFVNPTQFGPNEDLDTYPNNIENDLRLAEAAGVTVVFLPQKEEIYPDDFQTRISLDFLPDHLCGKSRPVFFGGIVTVVTKLFNIVMPDVTIFGKKDYQQFLIIRQMIRDLDLNIKILGGEIVREPDGLAMSSRNAYLTTEQRESALSLSRSLKMAEQAIAGGEKNSGVIVKQLTAFIQSFSQTRIDYICFCDPQTLEPVKFIDKQTLLSLAVQVDKTRLIDNIIIDPIQ